MKTTSAIIEDFRSAQDMIRLAISEPKTAKLRTAALERRRQLGTLRLSLSSVAEQAGHARTLIASASPDSPYAEVRKEIIEAIGPKQQGVSQRETIDRLRAEVAILKQKVRARDSRNLELVERLEKARVEGKLALQAQERIGERPDDYDPYDDGEDDPDCE